LIIQEIKAQNVRIPLDDPKTFSTKHITYRDYTLVHVRTRSGVEGWSYVWGLPVVKNVIDMYKDLAIGESVYSTAKIWNKIFKQLDRWDRSGIGMRALSGIDIALWDAIGKAAQVPIYRLMGAYREEIEAYYSGGYYPASCEDKKALFSYLEKELSAAYERGFRSFKMKIGAANPALDIERIGFARKTIGPDCKLMLDANCGYDPETIIPMAKKFEQ
jgi:D-arabinonate dehydratase